MRYRALDAAGDYTFGRGEANFLVDSRAAVAQSMATRLKLWRGEWFLDDEEGTPWLQQVLGVVGSLALYDLAIQQRILGTEGVTGLANYSSNLDSGTRHLSIRTAVNTEFGQIILEGQL